MCAARPAVALAAEDVDLVVDAGHKMAAHAEQPEQREQREQREREQLQEHEQHEQRVSRLAASREADAPQK